MANQIEGYIGCAACGTALFRLEVVPADRPGVFQNQKAAIDGADIGLTSCPNEGCGQPLTRVPAPA